MPQDPVLNNGGTLPASSYANDQQPLGDQQSVASGAQKNKSVHSNSAQGPDAKGANTLFQSHGAGTKLPDAGAVENHMQKLSSVSFATDTDPFASDELQLETGGPTSSLDDIQPASLTTMLAHIDPAGSLDPNHPDFRENLVEDEPGPIVPGPNILLKGLDNDDANDIADVDAGGVRDNGNNAANNLYADGLDDVVGLVSDGGNHDAGGPDPASIAPHAPNVPNNSDDGSVSSGVKAPDAPPKFLEESPKLKGVWSAVTKRLTVPDLAHDNSAEGRALKGNVDKYHGALDELKKDISEIDKSKPAKKQPMDSKAGAEELQQLKKHLGDLKGMNAQLAAVTEDDFPGDNAAYQHWQNDLQSHSDAFDSLAEIVDLILKGDITSIFHDDDDNEDKDKNKGQNQQVAPPSVPPRNAPQLDPVPPASNQTVPPQPVPPQPAPPQAAPVQPAQGSTGATGSAQPPKDAN